MKNINSSKKSNSEIINSRKMINGYDDGLMQVHPLKHPLSMEIFQKMIANTWMPQEVEMTRDVEMWHKPGFLTDREKRCYERCLAFASNLDGLLTDSIANDVGRHITSPEARLVVVRHAFEEAVHVLSYATMVEALGLNPERIYGLYRTEKTLHEKNEHIQKSLNKIAEPNFRTGTFENDQAFLESCISNIILEGIFFYSVFLFFYVLKKNNKMPGSAEMIQFINRDEEMHVKHFIYISNTIIKEQPELWTKDFQEKIKENFRKGVELEINWAKYYLEEGILGLNLTNLEEYIKHLGNRRIQSLGLPELWPNMKNHFGWLDEMTQGAMTETNFFEGRVREYSSGTLDWD
jgi:ribonucleoside-diphosphate reductase beta chain